MHHIILHTNGQTTRLIETAPLFTVPNTYNGETPFIENASIICA